MLMPYNHNFNHPVATITIVCNHVPYVTVTTLISDKFSFSLKGPKNSHSHLHNQKNPTVKSLHGNDIPPIVTSIVISHLKTRLSYLND